MTNHKESILRTLILPIMGIELLMGAVFAGFFYFHTGTVIEMMLHMGDRDNFTPQEIASVNAHMWEDLVLFAGVGLALVAVTAGWCSG